MYRTGAAIASPGAGNAAPGQTIGRRTKLKSYFC